MIADILACPFDEVFLGHAASASEGAPQPPGLFDRLHAFRRQVWVRPFAGTGPPDRLVDGRVERFDYIVRSAVNLRWGW